MGVSPNSELGDLASFCVDCGWARRYMPGVVEPPETCPACGGEVISACRACKHPIGSVMDVECGACGRSLRTATASGVRIRRGTRRIEIIPGDS